MLIIKFILLIVTCTFINILISIKVPLNYISIFDEYLNYLIYAIVHYFILRYFILRMSR